MSHWFIQYGSRNPRHGSAGAVHFSEAITDKHPVEWLIDHRERHPHLIVHIVHSLSISGDQAAKWDGEVG